MRKETHTTIEGPLQPAIQSVEEHMNELGLEVKRLTYVCEIDNYFKTKKYVKAYFRFDKFKYSGLLLESKEDKIMMKVWSDLRYDEEFSTGLDCSGRFKETLNSVIKEIRNTEKIAQ